LHQSGQRGTGTAFQTGLNRAKLSENNGATRVPTDAIARVPTEAATRMSTEAAIRIPVPVPVPTEVATRMTTEAATRKPTESAANSRLNRSDLFCLKPDLSTSIGNAEYVWLPIQNAILISSPFVKKSPVVNLSQTRMVLYLSLFCVNQWEEEKYFILLSYWLKSKGTSPMSF
jgi:hypothetical protein